MYVCRAKFILACNVIYYSGLGGEAQKYGEAMSVVAVHAQSTVGVA